MMPAQTLPQLPTDPHIRKGTLKCGVKYFLVSNPAEKGFADIAIVRKGEALDRGNRAMLDSLLNFSDRKPYRFLSDNGIGCREDGWASTHGNVTVFHFDRVPTFNEAVQDSTLLLSFNLIGESLTDQAIIVSGDIKVQDIIDKMAIFSLSLLPRFYPDESKPEPWAPADTASFSFVPSNDAECATVMVRYLAPRASGEYLNTAQPLVSANMYAEMGEIICDRLARNLSRRGYPYGGIQYAYTGSDKTGGPESHEVTVLTDRYRMQAVSSVIAQTLAAVDAGAVSPEEFISAKNRLLPDMLRLARQTRFTNAEYVEKCKSAFLYGTNLASFGERASLFTRNLPAETEAALFNGVAGALMDRQANLSVQYSALPDSIYQMDPLVLYALSWDSAVAAPELSTFVPTRPDTTRLVSKVPKTKIKKEAAEPVSGGKQWTFSNGMQVIFKKMGNDGTFSYSLFIKGGYAALDGLQAGEGAFLSDLLTCYDVSGMKARDFRSMLSANGIVMEPDVTASGISIGGTAPYNKLELTVRSLLSLTGAAVYSPDAVAEYMAGERLRLRDAGDAERQAYDAVFPDYSLSPFKDPARLTPALGKRADRLFKERFQNVQDGVLVICGDLNEEAVKKLLVRYMGGFHVGRTSMSRKSVSQEPVHGFKTLTAEGKETGVLAFISAPLPYSATHVIAGRIAMMALRKNLVAALAEEGYSVSLQSVFSTAPEDNFQVFAVLRPASRNGLPEHVGEADARRMLEAFRKGLAAAKIAPSDFNGYKASVVQAMTDELTDPSVMVRLVLARFAEGKDLISRFQEQAKAVTAAQVDEILSALSAGSRAEVIVP